MSMAYAAPRLARPEAPAVATESQWAVAAAVAAFLGIAVAVVIYICSVCDARSFWACVNAVENYWGPGC